MRIFGGLYDRVLSWSAHPHARWYLGGLSFAESSFFPIPPDVMLAPMCLARPGSALSLASLTTVTSVAGGIAGYAIGYFALEAIEPLLKDLGYWDAYLTGREWFTEWGVLAVLIAGFSPIPYKIFTISAGAAAMAFPGFVIASFFGRGARFFLVAGLIALGGQRFADGLRRRIDLLGWLFVALCLVVVAIVAAR